MIGALLMQRTLKRRVRRAVTRRDPEAILGCWADDGVLEYGGTHNMAGRFVGTSALRSWFERWLDDAEQVRLSIGRVAATRPWALGFTNTLMFEVHLEETSYDDRTVQADGVVVMEVRSGKVVGLRVYPFDETPDLAVWGRKEPGRSFA
jgi:ketosteroid isomerase-like protein